MDDVSDEELAQFMERWKAARAQHHVPNQQRRDFNRSLQALGNLPQNQILPPETAPDYQQRFEALMAEIQRHANANVDYINSNLGQLREAGRTPDELRSFQERTNQQYYNALPGAIQKWAEQYRGGQ